MPTGPPGWLALLSPIPADAKPGRKPVASAEQIEKSTAGPIAGWQSISVHLSEPEYGLRHVLITLDENGQLLSGGDLEKPVSMRRVGPALPRPDSLHVPDPPPPSSRAW